MGVNKNFWEKIPGLEGEVGGLDRVTLSHPSPSTEVSVVEHVSCGLALKMSQIFLYFIKRPSIVLKRLTKLGCFKQQIIWSSVSGFGWDGSP